MRYGIVWCMVMMVSVSAMMLLLGGCHSVEEAKATREQAAEINKTLADKVAAQQARIDALEREAAAVPETDPARPALDRAVLELKASRDADAAARDKAAAAVAKLDKIITEWESPPDAGAFAPLLALLPEPLRTPATPLVLGGLLLLRANRLGAAGRSIAKFVEDLKASNPAVAAAFADPAVKTKARTTLTQTAARLVDEAQGKAAVRVV